MTGNNPLLLEVKDLRTQFPLRLGTVRAVDGVDLTIRYGQTVGVVGESGCGKSVMARSVMRIEPTPGRIVSGELLLHRAAAQDTTATGARSSIIDMAQLDAKGQEARAIRGAEIAMIFQEPMASFSPVHTIAWQIIEGILIHQDVDRAEARRIAIRMLERVSMPHPERIIDRYPHQLSGGMRQRAMIAMALSCKPSLLVADEPTTALDVTTQAQILTLMRELQRDLGMAIMFITHDLGVVAKMTEYVYVMYLGKIVESANVVDLFHDAKHPYTEALLRSIPQLGRRTHQGKAEPLAVIPGGVPDPFSIPSGCPFHPRCHRFVEGVCDVREPPMLEVAEGHQVRCVLYE
jgi:oligopeptide/dipeptide ABC transporter ATP-binding protein